MPVAFIMTERVVYIFQVVKVAIAENKLRINFGSRNHMYCSMVDTENVGPDRTR